MKKYHISILSALIILAAHSFINAQNQYNIRLAFLAQPKTDQVCYEIQLASADLRDLNLAGQNYRLYYDTEKFRYNPNSSQSLLPMDKYTPLVTKDDLTAINASGIGILPFEENLGFLNIGLDLNDVQNGGIVLPTSGEWVNTAQLCFDYINPDNSLSESQEKELYWAREALTDVYATAYVEVAEWTAPFKTQPALVDTYHDIALSTSLKEQLWQQAFEIYPNPTKDNVFVKYESQEETNLILRGINGAVLMHKTLPKGVTYEQVNLTAYPSGMYQLEVKQGQKRFFKKIEKIH